MKPFVLDATLFYFRTTCFHAILDLLVETTKTTSRVPDEVSIRESQKTFIFPLS